MENVPSPAKLKWLTIVCSLITIGCMIMASIFSAPIYGSYIVSASLALIYSAVPEDMRV